MNNNKAINYALFCYILQDNLAFEPTANLSEELLEEWLQDWYADFKHTHYGRDESLSSKEKVVGWMRHAFSETTFDTHHFQIKIRSEWQSADMKPPVNLGVLVFIPEEDNHMTAGMWDISQQWVLLDENRVPTSEVTHWQLLPEPPEIHANH